MMHICRKYPNAGERLQFNRYFTDMDRLFGLFNAKFRPVTTRLTRMMLAFNSVRKDDLAPSADELDQEKNELEKRVLPSLNSLLAENQFFCGDEITCIDIQIYCELSTVIALLDDIWVDPDVLPQLY